MSLIYCVRASHAALRCRSAIFLGIQIACGLSLGLRWNGAAAGILESGSANVTRAKSIGFLELGERDAEAARSLVRRSGA
jgi:hypothetical protein